MSKCWLGKALTALGRATEGVELIGQGITGALEIGLQTRGIFDKTWLAQAKAAEGSIGEALKTFEQALQENPDDVLRPITLRLRGELRMKEGQHTLAEIDLRDALMRARRMGAKMWELQTIMSLARLLALQGRPDEARTMLAEIYKWFTEGFDTADLKEAKALLDDLSA
jgi:tetratricopeptide (TPR) repeat protein